MASDNVPTDSSPRLEAMLANIAELAKAIHAQAVIGIERLEPDSESDSMLVSIRYLSSHVGWLADLAQKESGGMPCMGHEALDWLMPPALGLPEADDGEAVRHG